MNCCNQLNKFIYFDIYNILFKISKLHKTAFRIREGIKNLRMSLKVEILPEFDKLLNNLKRFFIEFKTIKIFTKIILGTFIIFKGNQ